jgi:membrane-bound ClpP family serine protease
VYAYGAEVFMLRAVQATLPALSIKPTWSDLGGSCYAGLVKIVCIVLLVALSFVLVRRRQPHSKQKFTGVLNPIGLIGRAEETFTSQGTVFVQGEIWKATTLKGIVQKGDCVKVLGLREGLVLEVERISTPHSTSEAGS